MVNEMQIYKVGGCIRDKLLGIPVGDNDFVVVGSSPEEMSQLGFKAVGSDFPVFLHPETHEEYALARSEKKVSVGYRGFVFNTTPDISLEEDLARRDITINAIAEDEKTGELIDPFGGQIDLQKKIIRHVSEAFIEDPLRVLRVARFSAKLNFQVAEDTLYLMLKIVKSGELKSLSSERIWLEISKALMTKHSGNFFKILHAVGALEQILPEFIPVVENTNSMAFFQKISAKMFDSNYPLEKRFAFMCYLISCNFTQSETLSFIEQVTMSNRCKQLAMVLVTYYEALRMLNSLSCNDLYSILSHLDPSRRQERYQAFIELVYLIAITKGDQRTRDHLELLKTIIDRYSRIKYEQIKKTNPNDFVSLIQKQKLKIIEETISAFPES